MLANRSVNVRGLTPIVVSVAATPSSVATAAIAGWASQRLNTIQKLSAVKIAKTMINKPNQVNALDANAKALIEEITARVKQSLLELPEAVPKESGLVLARSCRACTTNLLSFASFVTSFFRASG